MHSITSADLDRSDLETMALPSVSRRVHGDVDDALDITQLTASFLSGQSASLIEFGENGINVPGSGAADLRFRFTTADSNRFTGTESSVYLIQYSGAGTLTSNSFAHLFANAGNKPNGYSSFHVQGLADEQSVHVAGVPRVSTVVPEPSSILLSGLGIVGFGLVSLSRRGRRKA
jgi:hypothetical protein